MTGTAANCTVLQCFAATCVTAGGAGIWHFLCASISALHILDAGENDDDDDSEGMSDWEEDNGEEGNEGDEAMSDDGDSSTVSGVSSEEARLRCAVLCAAQLHFSDHMLIRTCNSSAGMQLLPLLLLCVHMQTSDVHAIQYALCETAAIACIAGGRDDGWAGCPPGRGRLRARAAGHARGGRPRHGLRR
jgi:hypothetical protein